MKDTKESEGTLELSEDAEDNKLKYIIIIAILFSALIGAVTGIMLGESADDEEVTAMPVVTLSAITPESTIIPTPGPTIEPSPTAEVNSHQAADLIDIIAAERLNGMNKRCYLTFDDGPSANVTLRVLDILKKYNIKATFFQVGTNIRKYPDVTRHVHSEGHLLANHSYNHNYETMYANEETFVNEIKACEMELSAVIGEPVEFKLMRFPGGGYDSGKYAAQKQEYKQTLVEMGYYYCDWNVLNGDAEGKEKDAQELVEFFKNSAQTFISEGKNLIVLMHDTDAKQSTADSLEEIILYLSECGYTFHRLDDVKLKP